MRLRMVTPRDAAALTALLRARGLDPEELEVGRLVRFDPRRRLVVCATALIDSREVMLGIGAVELEPYHQNARPYLLVVDREQTEGLDTLLERALVGRAAQLAGSRAA